MKKIFKRLILILPSIIIVIAIYIASSQPSLKLPDIGVDIIDKLIHFTVYFIFGVSLQLCVFAINRDTKNLLAVIIVTLIGLIYAALDEYHQSHVPGRDANIYDFIADALGIIISQLFIKKIKDFVLRFLN